MKLKTPPLLMLTIGLAVGILVGYSLHDRPITAEERAYLQGREARESLETAMSQIRLDYQTMLENKWKVAPLTNGNLTPHQMQQWPQHKFRPHNLQDENSWSGRGVNQQKDLIDQRYTPPHIELP